MNIPVTVYAEMTPNPSTMKFVANKHLLGTGDSVEFQSLKQAKGYFGRRKNVWTIAKNAVDKAMLYAYRDRKTNKRNF